MGQKACGACQVYTACQVQGSGSWGLSLAPCMLFAAHSTLLILEFKGMKCWGAEHGAPGPCYVPLLKDSALVGPHPLCSKWVAVLKSTHKSQTGGNPSRAFAFEMLVGFSSDPQPCCFSLLVAIPLLLKGKGRKGILPLTFLVTRPFVSEWVGIFHWVVIILTWPGSKVHTPDGKILFKIKSAEDEVWSCSVSLARVLILAGRGKVNISRSQVNAVNIVWIYENWLRE